MRKYQTIASRNYQLIYDALCLMIDLYVSQIEFDFSPLPPLPKKLQKLELKRSNFSLIDLSLYSAKLWIMSEKVDFSDR